MGRHLDSVTGLGEQRVSLRQGPRALLSRPVLRGRVALPLFAFFAVAAFTMVTVTDPYAGATASPYFQPAGEQRAGEAPQTLAASGGYQLGAISRDNFTVTEKPKPPPPPPPPAVTAPTPEAALSAPKAASAPPAVVASPGSAQAYAAQAVAARGWGSGQFDCLVALWNKESGWRVNAYNPSGAYGIPQALPGSKMASAGADWQTNPATQIEWGLGYITGRYGSPCGAWAHSQALNWY